MSEHIWETLTFAEEEGEKKFDDVALYALSTCGFCKQAISFLQKNRIQFRFVYVDKLDMEVKQELKSQLKGRFGESVGFPYLVVNDADVLVGFKENEWKSKFSIE